MKITEYELKKAKMFIKKDKKQEKESEKSENETDFYDIMLEAIKSGLLPRSS